MIITGKNHQFMVVLKQGEKLIESLTAVLKEKEIQGANLTAIGAVKDVELGYYDLHHKNYVKKCFEGDDYELISLMGNLSLKEGEPFVHLHALISDKEFNVYGGHLFELTVAVTAEIFVTPLGAMPIRKMDSEIGLALISDRREM